MTERWVGITVSGDKITLVDAEVDTNGGPIAVQADTTWKLQQGDRSSAYHVMYQQLFDFLTENKVDRVIIKESALSQGGVKKAHLEAAELRGVVRCAAAAATAVKVVSRARISRTFGERKVDEYLEDDEFWSSEVSGIELRNGSREAALLLLASR